MKWTTEKHNYLIYLRQQKLTWPQIAEKMTEKFDDTFTAEACRSRWRKNRHLLKDDIDPKEKYGQKFARNPDGTIDVEQLIEISKTQLKDDTYILEAHGYDADKWEIVSHQFSMWNHHNKQDGTKTLYASKIRIKPKTNVFNWNELINAAKQAPKAIIKPKHNIKQGDRYLLLPLYDMHFGISDYLYYKPTQAEVLHLLQNKYKEVLVIFGQDAFHNDDFRGRTSSGREIQKVDMVKAWNDAILFFEPIIHEALQLKSKVTVIYSKGNHSETMEWAFVQRLKARFPECNYDDSLKERKAYLLGTNFIGTNHGDKKNEKKLPENFATEFPIEWSKATSRTVFTGHRHSEEVTDVGGVLVRRMPTRNKIDDWHDNMGYTTAHQRFQVFEFSESELKRIYYV